ncbi:acylamide-delta3(E)-desaturase [Hortaea werneckii]|nr:acylamide-delta3(E)-desaturase [Hortaea werneckii]KAI6952232.1 acylamide-delta3(E)-desaturase [Hortaea werneckii]KAI7188686.1 acylamide-delta3(E)-desaturase [Hortaea werneckii]KAI7584821.1 acylamide-delta3(E)-desaturase [Hortaea werneckii]
MDPHPELTELDRIVLTDLLQDVGQKSNTESRSSEKAVASGSPAKDASNTVTDQVDTEDAIARLKALNTQKDSAFQPTIFTAWDSKDISPAINKHVVQPYSRFAQGVVRHPTDVVFLTHLLLYSRILNGSWAWLDKAFPYVLEPLMGHTWDSYYYHHVKHHHVEGNGPGDLSSTIRYQRDDIGHFLHYVGRFMFLIWLELPLYFIQRKKYNLGVRAFLSEISSYAFMYGMWRWNPKAATFVFLLPFFLLRIGLMVGNWGQHALVDELEPDSDYRSSITLIDVPSNRYSFNDGYHTAHHLNPRRHWREHPTHFLQSKTTYAGNGALVFTNIDYIMLTITLLRKDYMYLADRLVPIGNQIGMSKVEIANMLRTKTRAFTEADIKKRFK